MKKAFVLLLPMIIAGISDSFAQDKTINIYYDSIWQTTSADKAVYRRKFIDLQNYYSCFTFWVKNNKLHSKFYCLDMTSFPKKIGTFKSYYENGQLQDSTKYRNNGTLERSYKYFSSGELSDSISYNDNGAVVKADHYYISGKRFVNFFWEEKTNESVTEAFDEKGEKIKTFLYGKNAEFSLGNEEWVKYLTDNINSSIPLINKAPKGKYKVIIYFTITEDGDVTDIRKETNYGYGMEDEAIRVLKACPKWKPAISLDQIVKGYRRQPVTFVVN